MSAGDIHTRDADKRIADLEQQLADLQKSKDVMYENIKTVVGASYVVKRQLEKLEEAAQAAVDEGRTSTRIDKMLALGELLKEHQDGS